jgi:competence protein ComEC
MQLKKVSLFDTKRDFFLTIFIFLFIFAYAILIEFNNYKNLTKFNSSIVTATVLKQYKKTRLLKNNKTKSFQVLKLQADKGFLFYTTVNISFANVKGKKLKLELWAGKKSFYEYMSSFYAFSKVLNVQSTQTIKQKINLFISSQHSNKSIASIYQALYTATPLENKLQNTFSYLGISHLLAISGFHLGVLSFLLFFLFKTPYKFFHNRYFPYRNYTIDSFIAISSILLIYLLFLDHPASLLRSFTMLIVGFILYDRGFKVISMQTLFLTILIILSFFPRLSLSIGFWLSIAGVFYIFLFLIHFKHLNKIWQFFLIPTWVYIMMLPLALFIFESFSIYHPLSIIWTSLFTILYPLSIILHIFNYGYLLDNSLEWLLNLVVAKHSIELSWYLISCNIIVSILAIRWLFFTYVLLFLNLFIFIDSIYNIT